MPPPNTAIPTPDPTVAPPPEHTTEPPPTSAPPPPETTTNPPPPPETTTQDPPPPVTTINTETQNPTTVNPTSDVVITTARSTRTIPPATTPVITEAPSTVKTTNRRTTAPYTTRFVTTITYVTVTTIVPKPTVISGKGTTVFVTETTTTPVHTIVPDPDQPPPGTYFNTSDGGDGQLKPWQTTLIVVACLILAMAVGAVCFVGRLKKRRRNREMSENAFHMALGGPSTGRNSKDSAIGSEMTVGGEKLNRTPVAQHAVIGAENVTTPGAEHPGRLSAMFRQSWGALGTYWGNHRHAHQNQDRQKQYYHQAGGAGGLWFNEDHNDLGYRDSAMTAAEAMHHPVSYRNDSTWSAVPLGIQQELEQTSHIASGQPTVDEHYGNQHPRLKQQQSAPSIGQVAAAEAVGARSNSLSSASQTSSQALRISGDTFGNSGATVVASSMPTSPLMVRPMSGGSLIGQEEARSRTSQYFPPPPDRYVDSRRESQDRGGGIGRSDMSSSAGQATDRIIIMVDPNQLESNALFEHVRKGPQGLPGSVLSPPSSPVVQLRREAEASVDVAAGLERRQALEADIKALEVGHAATLATQASDVRGTEIQGLTDILEPVEEFAVEEEAEDEHLRNEDVDAAESDSLVTARETQDHSDIDSDEESAGTSNGYDILQGFDDDH